MVRDFIAGAPESLSVFHVVRDPDCLGAGAKHFLTGGFAFHTFGTGSVSTGIAELIASAGEEAGVDAVVKMDLSGRPAPSEPRTREIAALALQPVREAFFELSSQVIVCTRGDVSGHLKATGALRGTTAEARWVMLMQRLPNLLCSPGSYIAPWSCAPIQASLPAAAHRPATSSAPRP